MIVLFVDSINGLPGSLVTMLLNFLPIMLAMEKLDQPYFVAYIPAGIILGLNCKKV